MSHEKIPIIRGSDCYELHMFIKLPEKDQLNDGLSLHLRHLKFQLSNAMEEK